MPSIVPQYIRKGAGWEKLIDQGGQETSQCLNCNMVIGPYKSDKDTRSSRRQNHAIGGGTGGCQHWGSWNKQKPRVGRGGAR
jgi:hypothetical protein